jgi:hypothetical protein
MDDWAQVFSGMSTAAFLVASMAGLFCVRMDRSQGDGSKQERGTVPSTAHFNFVWRIGTAAGIAALIGSIIVRSVTASTSNGFALASVGDRATTIAAVTSLLALSQNWRSLVNSRHSSSAWGVWLIVAMVTGIGVLSWHANDSTAPVLLGCTVISAGVGLWSIGHHLDAQTADENGSLWPFLTAFSGLTATIVVIGAVNWWAWGTPAGMAVGEPSIREAFVVTLAVWLVGATVLVLYRRASRFSFGLSLVYAAALTGIALSVQWKLPFS